MITRETLLEQNKAVQSELAGIAKGYEQALNWVLNQIEGKTQTTGTGTTVIVDQEK